MTMCSFIDCNYINCNKEMLLMPTTNDYMSKLSKQEEVAAKIDLK